MAGRRIEMQKVKEVLRLRLVAGLSNRKIAACTGVGKSAVCKHVARAGELGLEWERIVPLPEESLAALLYPAGEAPAEASAVVPDWDEVARELRRKGVTKRLLWQEYGAIHKGQAYSYSRYCELYGSARVVNAADGLSLVITHRRILHLVVTRGRWIPISCDTTRRRGGPAGSGATRTSGSGCYDWVCDSHSSIGSSVLPPCGRERTFVVSERRSARVPNGALAPSIPSSDHPTGPSSYPCST